MRLALALPALLLALPSSAVCVAGALHVGDRVLAPASCAVRKTIWIEHYAAALYVQPKAPVADAVQDPREPKALQVLILNKTFLPADLPRKWRRTLEGQLDPGTLTRVREAYKELGEGDLITLSYAPGPGIVLDVNGDVVARTPSHALIDALLRDFADGSPIPERVARTVQRHPC